MSTIIVYKWDGTNDISFTCRERQEGMKEAGKMLREKLAEGGGSANDVDAEDRVKEVLDTLIAEKDPGGKHLYDVRYEKGRLAPVRYRLNGKIDKHNRYKLIHPDNLGPGTPDPKLNGKLRLDVGLEDEVRQIFRMRLTVPGSAGSTSSWSYLSDDINCDLNEIEKLAGANTNIQNYLISTFMFSRCR